ncbi:MAG: haloacid dehalogenase-like hydrolase [Deltaproteobacteria bacterium]|nr:haloacid dehalogenase-like hydrolase [Deltaproteobacteria bacterium]
MSVLAALVLLSAPPATAMSECLPKPSLDGTRRLPNGRWSKDTHARLTELLDSRGAPSETFDPCRRPLAVIDLDHTFLDGDLAERAVELALEDGLVRSSPELLGVLPEDLRSKLADAKDAPAIRTAVLETYAALAERDRAASRAWLAQLFLGSSRDKLAVFAAQFMTRAFSDPPDAEGARPLRVRSELYELAATLSARGFDVFVITDSPEWLARAISSKLGVRPDRVLGIRLADPGVLGARVSPPVPEGGGKVQVIRTRIAPGGRVPALVVADAALDLAMLSDASGLAVLIDRGDATLAALAASKSFAVQAAFVP